MFDKLKREAMEYRWIWEREWLRDLYYVANRQWITFHPTRREWVDKRLQKWVPRPVTNKMAETLQSIRTNLGAINLSVKARPIGNDAQSVAAAEITDQISPLIHTEHDMDQVMREADFWLITTGNACLQISWNKDVRFNKVFVPHEQCLTCGAVVPPKAVVDAGQHCPQCRGTFLEKAKGPDGKPIGEFVAFGKGKTTALSPFEYAFPPNITRFDDLPYIIRLRWRDKHYYEANHPEIISRITWEKSPADRSMQIFKSLALTNDVGTGSQFAYLGAAGAHTVEGATEYELWLRPTPELPTQ
jgi:DNA-directed RNA polymerase subunit RPC12/RpoP